VFDTVLIADRGEPAARVIETCQQLGIKAVSVHSDSDAKAPHATVADESVLLGGEASYGDELAVLEAARQTGAQAVYAERLAASDTFAEAVRAAGLTWIDPTAPVEEQLRRGTS
jgi:3-methylcrotonyl-CoA carboxylase alpha subunit